MPRTLLLATVLLLAACGAPSATTTEPNTTSEPVQPEAPTESQIANDKVTLAQYEQLSEGMTLEEVEAVIGAGTEMSSSEVGGIKTVMYQWEGSGGLGANMNAMFQNGEMISKSQFGLK